MSIFGKKQLPIQPPCPASRTIPKLEPGYFESIYSRLIANGGSGTSTEIAYGVGNAIFNTGSNYLQQTNASKALRDFETLFGDRTPRDREAADRMVDFLVTHDKAIQAGESGWLGTLVKRLDDVLSRPA